MALVGVLLEIILLIIYILLPIVPAYVIFKNFPTDPINNRAEGIIGNLKINVTGAFAAYVIVAALAYIGIIAYAQNYIKSLEFEPWTIKSKIVFENKFGEKLDVANIDQEVKNFVTVDVRPNAYMPDKDDYISKSAELVDFTVLVKDYQNLVITYEYSSPGNKYTFGTQTIDLQSKISSKSIKIDDANKLIDVGDIVFKESDDPYDNDTKPLTGAPIKQSF